MAVYSEKLEIESARLQAVAESGPEWREEDSSVGLTPPEEALIRAIRFLGEDYAKDLYYSVMSRARRVLPERQMSKEEVEELRAALRALGKAAIE